MDVEHKKTALDDDAELYKQRSETPTKEDLQHLTRSQKMTYFKDYYLKYVIVGIILLVFAVSLFYTTILHREEPVLSIALINQIDLPEKDALSSSLWGYLGETDKDHTVDIYYFNIDNYQNQIAYSTRLAAGSFDALICSEDDFLELSAQGTFLDLTDVLPDTMQAELAELITVSSEGVMNDEGEIIGYLDPLPHGIRLEQNTVLASYGLPAETCYLGIAANAKHIDQAFALIRFLTEAASAASGS